MADLPWIAGAILFLIYFAIFETAAFRHPKRFNTLSRFVATAGQKFPLTLFLVGLIVGALATHFWWHWCLDMPPGVGG